jgi:hypothetical protein
MLSSRPCTTPRASHTTASAARILVPKGRRLRASRARLRTTIRRATATLGSTTRPSTIQRGFFSSRASPMLIPKREPPSPPCLSTGRCLQVTEDNTPAAGAHLLNVLYRTEHVHHKPEPEAHPKWEQEYLPYQGQLWAPIDLDDSPRLT